jgi:hypothetical protein
MMSPEATMKRPGRPPIDRSASCPSPDIHLTVSAPVFDALEVLVKQKRQSVQDLIRRSIRHLLDNERRGSV